MTNATDGLEAAACGCAVQDQPRRAAAVDPELKRSNLHRLRRIEGQVRGVQQMVEADRYCADILVQVSSIQEALRAVGRALLRNHLQHCVTHAVAKGPDEARATFDELVQLFDRHAR
ncbi:MAG TPA: metal-sensitive transcriptional regulator [Vicinamibacterales bacterium]|nr:metal-sensitive transcriptional regulator [Vicinamibacterales bacterium]